jgi:hypothetical protein
MILSRRSIAFLLILSPLALSGCHTTHAHSTPAQPSASAAQSPSAPAVKHPPRDSALSVYHNPAYGLSFRYPRTYLLDESSDSENSAIAEAQQRLATDQPGAILVALVSIPPDAYPNTTFASGTLQFIVDPTLTSETCLASVIPNGSDAQVSSGTSTISGTRFHWLQSSELDQPRTHTTRVYNAFIHGACYEFQLEVSTEPSAVPDFAPKPADTSKILHQLEKIVSSLQIHPVPAPPSPRHPDFRTPLFPAGGTPLVR